MDTLLYIYLHICGQQLALRRWRFLERLGPILHPGGSILHFFRQFYTPAVQFYTFFINFTPRGSNFTLLNINFTLFNQFLHPGGPILHFLMPLGPGAESLNFVNFQGPEHVKHEGLGSPGKEKILRKNDEKSV